MSDSGSGFPLPSRDAQELPPGTPWQTTLSDQEGAGSKFALALAILSEKIKSGALPRSELMQRIVAQASAATGAKGVALALRSEPGGLVICCAATGDMAPPPGTTLNEESGFTAECLRNGTVMICEDSETDERVDRAACRRLGVRSIVAAPVENDGVSAGVLEALSDEPAAFSKPHIEILLTLACFAKSAVAPLPSHLDEPPPNIAALPVPVEKPPQVMEAEALRRPDVLEKVEDTRPWSERVPPRVRLAIAGGAVAALLLAVFATAVFIWMWRHNSDVGTRKPPQASPQQSASTKPAAGMPAANRSLESSARGHDQNGRKSLVVKASAVEKLPTADAIAVTPKSQEPAPGAGENIPAPAVIASLGAENNADLGSILSSPERLPVAKLPTSQGVTPARLEHRVEPVYPQEARHARIEGAVVLRAAIDEAGNVKTIRIMKGSPILAQAAVTAVHQWHYQPSQLNHRPVASTTDITILFHLD